MKKWKKGGKVLENFSLKSFRRLNTFQFFEKFCLHFYLADVYYKYKVKVYY